MSGYQTDLNGQYIQSNYHLEKVQDSRGFFKGRDRGPSNSYGPDSTGFPPDPGGLAVEGDH